MGELRATPGPWEAVPQNGAGPIIARRIETGSQMRPTGLRLVCHMLERKNSLPQDQANARLIAAAPDLYSSCSAMLGLVQLILNRGDLSPELRAVLQSDNHRIAEAEAALAKAEGRS